MRCTFGRKEDDVCDTTAQCGKDSSGLIYMQKGPQVICNAAGMWESVCDNTKLFTEPICAAQPCMPPEVTQVTKPVFTEEKISDVYNEGTRATVAECAEQHVQVPGRNESVCDSGKWTVKLECTLKVTTCSITDLKTKAETIPHFQDLDMRCPGSAKKDISNVFGGESCPFECNAPYRPSNDLICKNGVWGDAECGKGCPLKACIYGKSGHCPYYEGGYIVSHFSLSQFNRLFGQIAQFVNTGANWLWTMSVDSLCLL